MSVEIVGEQEYSGDVLYRRALLSTRESGIGSRAYIELSEAELRRHALDALELADELRALGTMR